MCRLLVLLTAASVTIAVRAAEHDWPQLLGPTRDGVYRGAAVAEAWPSGAPRPIWKKQIGQGLAGPAVADSRLILFHRVRNEEVIEAFDAMTGAPQWRQAYPTSYRDDFGFDEGPRAVPVIAGGRVFTFGAEGQLTALDVATGKRLWGEATMQRFGVRKGFFGAAGSPLVEDGRVIANVGGKTAGIVAFNAATGMIVWTATDHGASYSSPTAATFGGKRYAVFLTREGVVGIEPATGTIGFQRRWRSRMDASVNAATPLIFNDLIFVSAEYGPGAALLRVQNGTVTPVWASDDVLTNHYATSVHFEGHLYGFHGRQEFGQSFRAVELKTGTVRWSIDRFGAGSVILAGSRLLIAHENGELILAAATPAKFQPIARARILPATVRALPALANGVLYIRNDDTLVALDLRR